MRTISANALGIYAEVSNEGTTLERIKHSSKASESSRTHFFDLILKADNKDYIPLHLQTRGELSTEQVTLTIFVSLSIYLIFGSFAQLICNLIGFAYPAYASVKAVRMARNDDETQWLIYWTVFAGFSFIDNFIEIITKYFPMYWFFKAFFLLYLYFPNGHGARLLYESYVNPAITTIDDCIDAYKRKRKTISSQRSR